jgi:hypothetical protein
MGLHFLRLPNPHSRGKILVFKTTSIDQTGPSDPLIGRLIISSRYRKKPRRITPSSPVQVGPSGGADDLSPEGGNVTWHQSQSLNRINSAGTLRMPPSVSDSGGEDKKLWAIHQVFIFLLENSGVHQVSRKEDGGVRWSNGMGCLVRVHSLGVSSLPN